MNLKVITVLFLTIPFSQPAFGQIPNQGVDLTGFSMNYYSLPFIDFEDRQDLQYTVDKDTDQY